MLNDKPHNSVIRLIVLEVWPDTELLNASHQAFRYGVVRDVIDGLPVPVLSQKDREAIETAAKPILAGAGQ